jgi:hypothetical protein
MKQWMKAVMGCTMGVTLAGLAGCGGGDGGSAGTGGDPALVGNWKMTSMSVNNGGFFPPATIGWDVQMQLADDGSADATEVWRGSTESSRGGWSAGGGQLNIAVGSYNWTGPYTVSASRFTLSNVPNYDGEGDLGSFVFSRQ